MMQRRLLYLPSKTPPSLENFKETYIKVQTAGRDKRILTHWYSKGRRPYIMIFHGNSGNIEDRAYKFKFLTDQGYSVMLVGYRGYGDNPGRPAEADLISDSALALEWLMKEEGAAAEEIVLLGESLGSGVAAALAARFPVGGLIFDGAFSSITDVGRSIYPFIPVQWLLKDRWDSLSRIQKSRAPLLLIHSKNDSVLPFRFALKLFQAAPAPKKKIWLEDADHNTGLETEFVRKSIFDFLQSVRRPPNTKTRP